MLTKKVFGNGKKIVITVRPTYSINHPPRVRSFDYLKLAIAKIYLVDGLLVFWTVGCLNIIHCRPVSLSMYTGRMQINWSFPDRKRIQNLYTWIWLYRNKIQNFEFWIWLTGIKYIYIKFKFCWTRTGKERCILNESSGKVEQQLKTSVELLTLLGMGCRTNA